MIQNNPEKDSHLDDIIEDSLYYKTFFGRSSDYYEERYDRFCTGESVTFNPYAFFLGVFWLSYRKMYIELIIWFLIVTVIESILFFAIDIDNPSLDRLFNLFWLGIIGCSANYFYFIKARRTVSKAKEMYANTGEQLDYLEREGGTSYIGPVIVGFILSAFFVGMIVLNEYIESIYY